MYVMIALWNEEKSGIVCTLFAHMPAHHIKNDALVSENEWDSG